MCKKIDAAPAIDEGGFGFAQACCWNQNTYSKYAFCDSMPETQAPITWLPMPARYCLQRLPQA